MIIEMHGPFEGPYNDQRMYREFGLNARLMLHCAILMLVGHVYLVVVFYLFADRGYVHGNPYVQVPYKGPGLQPYQLAYNNQMSKIRQPVEWSFGKVSKYFAFVDFEKNQKVYLQEVGMNYIAATLLSNMMICFRGNVAFKFFGLEPPSADEYLRM